MELLRWMGRMFARFVAVSVAILSAWMFIINVVEVSYSGWILAWILFSGIVGAAGGVIYLLSFDGPERFQKRRLRFWGWGAMLVAVLLPTSLTLMLVPMVVLLIPSLYTIGRDQQPSEEPITSV